MEAERAGEAVAEEGGALSDVHVVLDVQLVVVRSDERGDAHVLAHLRPKPSVHPNDQRRVFVGRLHTSHPHTGKSSIDSQIRYHCKHILDHTFALP